MQLSLCSNNSFYGNLSDYYLTGQKNDDIGNENQNSKLSRSSISFQIGNRSVGNSFFRRYGNNGNQNYRYRNNINLENGNIAVVTPGDENENENENDNSEIPDEERCFYENEIERLLIRGIYTFCIYVSFDNHFIQN